MRIKNLVDWLYIQYAWITSANNLVTFAKRYYYSYDTFYNVFSHSLSKAIYKDTKSVGSMPSQIKEYNMVGVMPDHKESTATT